MIRARYLTLLAGGAVLLLALVAIGAQALGQRHHDAVVWVMLGAGLVYAAAAWLIWSSETAITAAQRKRAVWIIVATAMLARCLLVWAPPLSTDIYRYVWDGRVEAAGINPYRYRPADPPLAFLRDAAVYPRINRAATAVTIYPPVAQMIFLAVTRVADSVTGMKAAMVGFEIATVAALLALLRAHNLPASRIVFYVWHPLPLFEFAGSGHIDAAAIALMLLACLFAQRRQPLAAGALLGAAALVKFFPAVIAPALYRRWDWRLPAALLAVVTLSYLPYLGVGRQVLGFLPGYVHEEGLADGHGFFLLNALNTVAPLPPGAALAYLAAAAALLGALAWAVTMRRNPALVSLGSALLLLAVFTLLVSPHLPWYFTWVIPLLCFKPSWAWLYLSAAAPLLYGLIWSPGGVPLHAALYVPFAFLVAIELWAGYRRSPPELSDDARLRSRHAG